MVPITVPIPGTIVPAAPPRSAPEIVRFLSAQALVRSHRSAGLVSAGLVLAGLVLSFMLLPSVFLEERLDVSPSTASARRCGEAGTRRAHGAEPAALGSEAPVRAGAFLFRELLSSLIAQGWGQRGGLQWPRRRERRACRRVRSGSGRRRRYSMRPADRDRGSSAWHGRACAPRSSVPSRSTAPARASQDCARRRDAGRSRADACSHGHAKLRRLP